MDLIDELRVLSAKAKKQRAKITNEAATRNVLVEPFIRALGYDTFNVEEVSPEFTADVGLKKGEKVDYAILKDNTPIMLIECKACGSDLSGGIPGQLYRYFSTTKARIGVLTDGIRYHFYSDLEEPNKMDEKPFLEFNLLDFHDATVEVGCQ